MSSTTSHDLVLFVNGRKLSVHNPDPDMTLLFYLRRVLGLPGTKLGCAEGGCGACTVMLSDCHGGMIRHRAATACLLPLCSLHGQHVTTVEGVGSTNGQLHVVQEIMARSNASQCGFCSPGFVMSMYALLRNHPVPSMSQLEAALAGNLCRCTGYRPIVEGFQGLTLEAQQKQAKLSNGDKNDLTNGHNGHKHLREDRTDQSDRSLSSVNHSVNGSVEMKLLNGATVCKHMDDGESSDVNAKCCGDEFRNIDIGNRSETIGQDSNGVNEKHAKQKHNSNSEMLNDGGHYSEVSVERAKNGDENKNDSAELNGNLAGECPLGEKCCKRNPVYKEKVESIDFSLTYDPETQESIFPSELQMNSERLHAEHLEFSSERARWFRPATLVEALRLKRAYPEAVFMAGNTTIGLVKHHQTAHIPVMIYLSSQPELMSQKITDTGIEIGSANTLTDLLGYLTEQCSDWPESKTRIFKAVAEMLRLVGSQQVRNVATVGGHVVAASPVSDLNPLFQAVRCVIRVISVDGKQRLIEMNEGFFTGLKTTRVSSDEIVLSVLIPFSSENEFVIGYKQSRKKSDDNANVTSGMRVIFNTNEISIKDIWMSFSGMDTHTREAVVTSKKLIGLNWNDEMMQQACSALSEELHLSDGTPGSKIQFRMAMMSSMFFKFYLTMRFMLEEKRPRFYPELLPQSYRSATEPRRVFESKGVRVFEQVDASQPEFDQVGRSVPHLSTRLHPTGEATYTDDLPHYSNELNLGLVFSTRCHAEIISVDASQALAMPGIRAYIDHRDVPGSNLKGSTMDFGEIFRTRTVTSEGQVIGAVLADTRVNARRAVRAVRIEYRDLPPILTVEEAIKAESYLPIPEKIICRGNVEEGMRASDHVIEGEFYTGGQKHFYMETQACLAVPKRENNEVEIFSATQCASVVQSNVAAMLGIDSNKIVSRVKRIGGGFGGKDQNSLIVALPVALAAHRYKQPVRCMLDRDEDMIICGGRHPFLVKYRVGFTRDGKLCAAEIRFYSNGGYSFDLSVPVLEEAMFHFDNAYHFSNIVLVGRVCKTNLPNSTAYRGFGAPQAVVVCENILNEMAHVLGVNVMKIREVNMYGEGDTTPYNQEITDWAVLRECWEEVLMKSEYRVRSGEVKKFNEENRWMKRGLSVVPIKGCVGTQTMYEQASALVHIYLDGSVLVSHGGMEMGQGLHTKMVQIASRVLEVPMSRIFISETSSNVVPNAHPTAASRSSDLNGMAMLEACQTLVDRLSPYRQTNPTDSWTEWVQTAYMDKVNLSAMGFYKQTGLDYDWETNTGRRFNYFTMGAACTEVELDCLTGEHKIIRVDIVMDVGKSLNPVIDIGQIQGAFIHGYGMFMLEEVQYSADGLIYNKGPNTYRLPTILDIPGEFNVSLLKGASNPRAVYSSKGVGEPPLLLATSVFFAVRDAVESARVERGLDRQFTMYSPATAERTLLALLGQDMDRGMDKERNMGKDEDRDRGNGNAMDRGDDKDRDRNKGTNKNK